MKNELKNLRQNLRRPSHSPRAGAVGVAVLSATLSVYASNRAFAADGSWAGAGTDDNWATAANWDVVPGSNDGAAGSNTDTALFSGVPSGGTVTIDANRNIRNLTFDSTQTTFAIGSGGGNTLHLTNGGVAQLTSTVVPDASGTLSIRMGAQLVLNGASYTFRTNAASAAVGFLVSGPISGGSSAATTLTLDGTNNAGSTQPPNQVNGLISNGASSSVGIVKNDTSSWQLSPQGVTNSYTGDTVVNQGTLRFASLGAASPDTHIIINNTGRVRFSTTGMTARSIQLNSGSFDASNSGVVTNLLCNSGPALWLNFTGSGTFSPTVILNFTGTTPMEGGVKLTNNAGIGSISLGGTGTPYDIGTVLRPFEIDRGGATDFDFRVRGPISGGGGGSGGIVKQGAGIMRIDNGANPFTGRVEIQGGTLIVNAANSLTGLPQLLVNGGTLHITGGQTQTFGPATLRSGAVTASNSASTLVAPSYVMDGGAGTTVVVNAIVANAGSPSALSKTGAGEATLNSPSNSYTGGTSVSAGTLHLATGAILGPGPVSATGGALDIIAGRSTALVIPSVAVSGTGAVDLNDNDLIVGNATTQTQIENYVRDARNGGLWNGSGLTSTTARTGTGNTNLGVLSGTEYNTFGGGAGVFNGQTYVATDTLVKYTYNGDTNFSGAVDFDDYVRVDVGFNTGLTGWGNGDFNYSGSVDFDDYVLIDVAFNTQSGTLSRAINYISGDDRGASGMDDPAVAMVVDHFEQFGVPYGAAFLAAVPEPASLATIGVTTLVGMARRRRRPM